MEVLPMIKETSILDMDTNKVLVTFHDGKQVNFKFLGGSLDPDLRLHGICELTTTKAESEKIENYPHFEWKPINIVGRFSHGKLQGKSLIGMSQHSLLFANFKDGVIHGPVFAFGVVPHYIDELVKRGFYPIGKAMAYQGKKIFGPIFGLHYSLLF